MLRFWFASLMCVAAGCGSRPVADLTPALPAETAPSAEQVAALARRAAFRASFAADLTKLDRQLLRWERVVSRATAAAQPALDDLRRSVQTQRDEFAGALARLDAADADTWPALRPEIERSHDRLQAAYRTARERFE